MGKIYLIAAAILYFVVALMFTMLGFQLSWAKTLLNKIERKEDIILEELKKAIDDLKAAVNNVATRIQNQIENLKANATDATTVKDLATQIEAEVAALNSIGSTPTPVTGDAATGATTGTGGGTAGQSGSHDSSSSTGPAGAGTVDPNKKPDVGSGG